MPESESPQDVATGDHPDEGKIAESMAETCRLLLAMTAENDLERLHELLSQVLAEALRITEASKKGKA